MLTNTKPSNLDFDTSVMPEGVTFEKNIQPHNPFERLELMKEIVTLRRECLTHYFGEKFEIAESIERIAMDEARRDHMADVRSIFFLARKKGKLVGVAKCGFNRCYKEIDEDFIIEYLCVAPEWRKQGIGRALFYGAKFIKSTVKAKGFAALTSVPAFPIIDSFLQNCGGHYFTRIPKKPLETVGEGTSGTFSVYIWYKEDLLPHSA